MPGYPAPTNQSRVMVFNNQGCRLPCGQINPDTVTSLGKGRFRLDFHAGNFGLAGLGTVAQAGNFMFHEGSAGGMALWSIQGLPLSRSLPTVGVACGACGRQVWISLCNGDPCAGLVPTTSLLAAVPSRCAPLALPNASQHAPAPANTWDSSGVSRLGCACSCLHMNHLSSAGSTKAACDCVLLNAMHN